MHLAIPVLHASPTPPPFDAALHRLQEPLVSEVQKLWGQGLLREGERVLLWEGLLAASVAAGPTLEAQIVGEWSPQSEQAHEDRHMTAGA